MPSMSTISICRADFQNHLFNGYLSCFKCSRRATASWSMSMDSRFPSTLNNKKEELETQLSTPHIPNKKTLKSGDLLFDRLQPSYQELGGANKFEFGQFIAREAVLDEEYWEAAWLRAESHWENGTYERYIENYKRKFADQEFNALKRRCRGKNEYWCKCIITVKEEQKIVKHTILKDVVGSLDLNIRYFLQGETFPGEQVKARPFCNIKTLPKKYGYIANLCVAKSARRRGIATNMMRFAVEYAKSYGSRKAGGKATCIFFICLVYHMKTGHTIYHRFLYSFNRCGTGICARAQK